MIKKKVYKKSQFDCSKEMWQRHFHSVSIVELILVNKIRNTKFGCWNVAAANLRISLRRARSLLTLWCLLQYQHCLVDPDTVTNWKRKQLVNDLNIFFYFHLNRRIDQCGRTSSYSSSFRWLKFGTAIGRLWAMWILEPPFFGTEVIFIPPLRLPIVESV